MSNRRGEAASLASSHADHFSKESTVLCATTRDKNKTSVLDPACSNEVASSNCWSSVINETGHRPTFRLCARLHLAGPNLLLIPFPRS